jgi:hypothetical protein
MRGDHHIGGQQGVEEAGTRAYPCVGFVLECRVLWSLRKMKCTVSRIGGGCPTLIRVGGGAHCEVVPVSSLLYACHVAVSPGTWTESMSKRRHPFCSRSMSGRPPAPAPYVRVLGPTIPPRSGAAWPEPVILPKALHVRHHRGGVGNAARRRGFGAHGAHRLAFVGWVWWGLDACWLKLETGKVELGEQGRDVGLASSFKRYPYGAPLGLMWAYGGFLSSWSPSGSRSGSGTAAAKSTATKMDVSGLRCRLSRL